VTYLWRRGDPIDVEMDSLHAPLSFVWRGRRHVVERVTGRWRLDGGWWRWRKWREYFKVTTHSGLLVILYHDLVSGTWYLQRLYD
jgi:hypothetical protein